MISCIEDSFLLSSILRLFLACLLGAILGIEREVHRHPAGLRTHILVSLGACAFILLGFSLNIKMGAMNAIDLGRVIQGVITGVGFIGAGAIMKEGLSVQGLTTAASLWVASSVGLIVGTGSYLLAIAVVILAGATLLLSRPHNCDKH